MKNGEGVQGGSISLNNGSKMGRSNLRTLENREKREWKCVVESLDCQDKVLCPILKAVGGAKEVSKKTPSHITNIIYHQV